MRINLKELREKAKRRDESGKDKSITREELSLMIEERLRRKIHVTQIARYEDDPANVPVELLAEWLRCLGTSLEEQILRSSTAESHRSIDPGDPYGKLRSRVSLLNDYIDNAIGITVEGDLNHKLPNLEDVKQLMHQIGRKPNVVLSGAFDAGKSTIANWLMTSDNPLLTQYQPTTAVVTYIRHIEDKPVWLREDVVLLGEGFKPEEWHLQDHIEKNRIVSGNLETLRDYGTHGGERAAGSGAESALVFIDSPILKACNLVDYPGYHNTDEGDEDKKRADKATKNMDVLVYASTATGFMDAPDMARLRFLLKALPEYETTTPGFPPLGNLFIVATHVGPQILESQYQELLSRATERLWRELKDLEIAGRINGKMIDKNAIGNRIFPFWRENQSRTELFAKGMKLLLSDPLPAVFLRQADLQVEGFRKCAGKRYDTAIASYQQVLQDIEAAEALYKEKVAGETDRISMANDQKKQVILRIEEIKQEHLQEFSVKYREMVNEALIEQQLRERYSDKKEAQKFMAGYVLSDLQARSEQIGKEKSEETSELIKKYVSSYEDAAGIEVGADDEMIEIPFDAKGSFIGGLAGLGSIGALSIWVSSLGNLGGYIVVAKAVSVLSALGIATGGTASMIGLVSALGGPITFGIGIGIALFFGLKALFGEDWQTRLARQIVEKFRKDGVEAKFKGAIGDYWDSTVVAFENGAFAVEEEFVRELKNLGSVFGDVSKKEEMEERLRVYGAAKDFFVGIPWITMWPGSCSPDARGAKA